MELSPLALLLALELENATIRPRIVALEVAFTLANVLETPIFNAA